MEKLQPGDPHHIGAYRLLGRLGTGGMGQVYLARSDRGRTVAVKLVRMELAEIDEFRDRFRLEVRAARRVAGPWAAPVLDADTEAPAPWVATGYVAGPSLHSVVAGAHGPLPERSVRILGSGLAHAVADIHAAGLVHRDLKPSNVLVTIDGPRVIDFGIARALETMSDSGLTRTGALVGSPGFMAPEQIRGDRITPACDVFCLGTVLAYAACGVLPFGTAESGVHALMFRIAQEPPDLGKLPESLRDLVADCLRKDPAARPTLARILERTDEPTPGSPWLPAPLVAQLGCHAVRLLDAEDPDPGEGEGSGQGALPDAQSPPEPDPEPPSEHGRPTSDNGDPAPGDNPAATAYAHPQSPYPQAPYPRTPPPPQPGYSYYTPAPAPGPSDRSSRWTVALIVVALIVAVGAGGSVYAVMNTDSNGPKDPASHSTTGPQDAAGDGSPATPDTSNASAPPHSSGTVPDAYLGTWKGSVPSASGSNPRRLVIRQGEAGDTVLSLTADGDGYHCVFKAELAQAGAEGSPLEIGPSTVTAGKPKSSCDPGEATELTLLPDGTLRRVNTATGDRLTYTKQD
ncbi:protein kinase domain-containing protein [Streptomyces sp. NBC_01180]|uniref:protein kinase domain-containing protein n=1 Tax=Streptomyces sp. NBC_01180 TaxID=2903763 RepID=UPI0038704A1D|nr:protein kinase [Streptomyces sp. NBC_01180]